MKKKGLAIVLAAAMIMTSLPVNAMTDVEVFSSGELNTELAAEAPTEEIVEETVSETEEVFAENVVPEEELVDVFVDEEAPVEEIVPETEEIAETVEVPEVADETVEEFVDETEDVVEVITDEAAVSEEEIFTSEEGETAVELFSSEGKAVPETYVEIEPGNSYDFSNAEGEYVMYKFTPSVTKVYDFYAESGDDTRGYLYRDVDGILQLVTERDDDNDGDFRFLCELKAGVTYYFEASGYNYKAISGAKVYFEEAPELVGIAFEEGLPTSFTEKFDANFSTKLKVKLSYSNEDELTVSLNSVSEYGHDVNYRMYVKGEEDNYVTFGDAEAGKTYIVEAYVDGFESVASMELECVSYADKLVELNVGDKLSYSCANGDFLLYKFTAPENAKYKLNFADEEEEAYPYIVRYMETEDGLNWDDSDNEQISGYLAKDTVYYFYVTDAYSGTVSLEILPEVTGIAFAEGAPNEVPERFGSNFRQKIQVEVSYSDGTSEVVSLEERGKYGDYVAYDLYFVEGEEKYDVGFGHIVEGKTYILEAYISNNAEVARISMNVTGISAVTGAIDIAAGAEYDFSCERDGYVLYKFIPSENGKYAIESKGHADTYVELYKKTETGLEFVVKNDQGAEGDNFRLVYELEADSEYYYKVSEYYGNKISSATVSFARVPYVTGVAFADDGMEYVLRYTYFDNTKVIWTYDNGETVTSTITKPTKYGDYLNRVLIDENGEEVEDVTVSGTYTLKVWTADEKLRAEKEITYISMQEAAKNNVLKLGEKSTFAGDKINFISFTTDAAGLYAFSTNVGKYKYLYDMNGREVEWKITDNYSRIAELEANTSYVLEIEYDIEDTQRPFELSAVYVQDITEISVECLKSSLLINYDSIVPDDFIVNVKYADGVENTIRGNNPDAYGNKFRYVITDENGDVVNGNGYLSEPLGKYQVKAIHEKDSSIFATVDIEVVNVDLDSLTEIKEDTEVTLNLSSKGQFFKFVPQKPDIYRLYSETGSPKLSLYKVTESGMEYFEEEAVTVGETYVAIINSVWNRQKVKISSNPYKGEIKAGEAVTVEGSGSLNPYKIVVNENGRYDITVEYVSGDFEEFEVAFYEDVYNTYSSKGKKDEPAVLKGRHIGETGTLSISPISGTYKVTVTKAETAVVEKTVRDFTLHAKSTDGYPLYLVDSYHISNFIEVTLNYTDGTTETVDLGDYYSDENNFSVSDSFSWKDETIVATATVTLENGGTDITKKVDVVFADKGENLTVLQEGQKVNLKKDREAYFYKFTADNSGTYSIQFDDYDYEIMRAEILNAGDEGVLYGDNISYSNKPYLYEGIEYIIAIRRWGVSDEETTLQINRTKGVKSLKVLKAPKPFFFETAAKDYLPTEMIVEVTYNDGTTAEISSMSSCDAYGNDIYVYWRMLSNDKARAYLECDNVRTYCDFEGVKVTDASVLNITGKELAKVTFEKEESSRTIIYTAKESGYYNMSVAGYSGGVAVYDGKGNSEAASGVYLEAGKTYFLVVYLYYYVEVEDKYVHIIITRTDKDCNNEHDYVEVVEEATCTEYGSVTGICRNCSAGKYESIKPAHKPGAWETAKPASCYEVGQQVQKCTVCKMVLTEKEIAKVAHKYGAWTETKPATVSEPGEQQRKCTVSGCNDVQRQTLAVLKPYVKLNINTSSKKAIALQAGKSTTAIKITEMAAGDSVYKWKSSNSKYVSVTKSGKLTAKKKGIGKTVTISLYLDSNKTKAIASFKVKVQEDKVATTKITGVSKTAKLEKGKKLTLAPVITPVTAAKATYKSSDKKVATVNKNGVITAKAPGKAKITVTSGSKSKSCTVTVPGIANVAKNITMKKGSTVKLNPKKYGISGKFTYSVTKGKNVVSVKSGKITAKKAGTATIKVKVGKYSVTCKVKVTK